MDMQQSSFTSSQIKHFGGNHSLPPVLKLFILFIVFIVGISVGLLYAAQKNIAPSQTQHAVLPATTTPTPIPIKPKITPEADEEQLASFTYDFMKDHFFTLQYPQRKNIAIDVITPKESTLPLSLLDKQFTILVIIGQTTIGVTDKDPSLCYKTTCKGALEEIRDIQNASISGVLAKKVAATAYPNNEVVSEHPQVIEMYVVPFMKKYVVLYGDGGNEFETLLKTLQIQ